MDAQTATAQRSMARLASVLNIPVEEETVAKTAIKTAVDGEIKDGTGSQNQTAQDAGDYGSASQALQDQVNELKNSGAEGGEEPNAVNNATADTDRKDYTINPNQDVKLSARNKALEAVRLIASKDPLFVKALKKVAEGGDLGTPMGGTPDAVENAPAPTVGDDVSPPSAAATPPAPVADAAPAISGDAVQVKLQDAIREKETDLNVQKQVVDQLKDVMTEVTSGRRAVKTKQATPPVNAPSVLPPKATPTTPVNFPVDVSPSETSTKQTTSPATASRKAAGKEESLPYSGREWDDYKLPKDPDWGLYDRDKDDNDSGKRDATGRDTADRKDYNRRGASLKSAEEADEAEEDKKEEDKKEAARRKRGGTGGVPAPNEMPGRTSGPTQEQKEYFNVGNSKDEVSPGNDATLESPETSRLIDDTRSQLDKRHKLDTAGATTASRRQAIAADERKKTLAILKAIDDSHDVIAKMGKKLAAERAITSPKTEAAVNQVIATMQTRLKKSGDAIEALLKTSGDAATIRRDLGNVIRQARPMVEAAKLQLMTMAAMIDEANAHKARFARVSPAFKLAVDQFRSGQIEMDELPVKVSEYIKMPQAAFEATAKISNEMAQKMAQRSPARRVPADGQEKFARRLPHVAHEVTVPQDELAGVFDDD